MKFIDIKLLEEALDELKPLEQILYSDALLCSRLINGTEDGKDDEGADQIRDVMDFYWRKMSEEERERLDKFMEKAGDARY